MTLLQVDDTLSFGDINFLHDEKAASSQFITKPRQMLTNTHTIFNVIRIRQTGDNHNSTISINQSDKIAALDVLTTQKAFSSRRALAQYTGVGCRPNVCATVQLIAPGNEQTTPEEFKSLRRVAETLKATSHVGLNFVRIDLHISGIIHVSDASFANARKVCSQLGFLILLMDSNGRANLIHYGSSRCRRITRSVMASAVHALVLGFDHAYSLRHMIADITGKHHDIHAYTDSKNLFYLIAKNGLTSERRLQIDVASLRESQEKRELAQLGWILGHNNQSDALTKERCAKNSPLWRLMETNSVNVAPIGWASV